MERAITFQYAAATISDIGLTRKINEDNASLLLAADGRQDVLAVVADGMGGHGFGDVASRIAADTVMREYRDGAAAPDVELRDAVILANRAIHARAVADPRLRGMGTTCTAIAIREDAVACAHVGDSRLYLARGGALYQMTEDHSHVRSLVNRGLITPSDALVHDERHILLRALGTEAEVAVSCWAPIALHAGDRLLLCTDGLHGFVSDDEIRNTLAEGAPEAACRRLVAHALDRGGHDNITAIVIHVTGAAS